MTQHLWCDGRFGDVSSLVDEERIIACVAGYTASGNLEALEEACGHLTGARWRSAAIEAILQTHLFAGYPRTINGMGVVRNLNWDVSATVAEETPVSSPHFEAAGAVLCGKIYGKNYPRLRERIGELHPDLDRWMLETGYGRVLSREHLSPRLRELCVLTALVGQNVPAQLNSHLRGAINVGASVQECRTILKQSSLIWGESAAGLSEGVLDHLIELGKIGLRSPPVQR